MLGEAELRVLQALRREQSVSELADRIDRSLSYTSEVVSDLEAKGLVHTRRVGKEKRIAPVEAKAVEHLQRLSDTHSHIDVPDLIAGKAIPILYYLDEPRTVAELADETDNYRNTVHRIITRLVNRGLVQKRESRYRLTDEFQLLNEFAREYVHHQHRHTAARHLSSFTILWESLTEFLLQTDQTPDAEQFIETGPARFQKYGLPLLTTDHRYYVYTEETMQLDADEMVCHTLLIDQETRSLTYCLLLIEKRGLDRDQLLATASEYELEDTIQTLYAYLDTHGEETTAALPDWRDFETTAAEYGVTV